MANPLFGLTPITAGAAVTTAPITTGTDLTAATGEALTAVYATGASNNQVLTADSTQASGLKWATSSPSGLATTVTGPDAFAAPAVVGTSSLAARGDHDHGLPVLSLSPTGSSLAGDVPLTANTTALVLTTASLAAGAWWITMSAELSNGGVTAGDAQIFVGAGTGAGSIAGVGGADGELPPLSGGSLGLSFGFVITMTTPGTLTLSARSVVAATVKALATAGSAFNATGYSAIKVG